VRLLYVCTGNLCRSPYAERRTLALLGNARDGLEITSAGTRAPVGEPVDPSTARLLAEHHLDASDHRARRLSADLVQASDLVLTMTGEHRSAVLEMVPGALRRTFSLAEAMSLADLLDPSESAENGSVSAGVADLAPRLAAVRARLPRPHPGFPDVIDPIGRSYAVHRQAASAIDQALAVLVPRLRAAVAR
jgi:protein-tyrosine phosphatase